MTTLRRTLDKLSLIGMAAGVAMMLQPWRTDGFRAGFFVTLLATVTQIVAGHLT
jgi:hypothetical protein